MSNPTELPDRLEALRAALKRISETRFGWDGDCGVTSIADDALFADDEVARRAQPEGEAPQPVVPWQQRLRQHDATLSPLCGAQHAESGKEAALHLAQEALQAVQRSYGMQLLSYPPQDAWMVNGVDEKVRTAVKAIAAQLDGGQEGSESNG